MCGIFLRDFGPKKGFVWKDVREWPEQHWHNLPQGSGMPVPSYTWPYTWPSTPAPVPTFVLFLVKTYFWSKTFWTWNLSSYHRCKIPYLHSCLWFYCCTHLVWEKIGKCKVLIVLLWLKNATSFWGDSQVIRMQRGARRLHNHSEREQTMRITIKSSTTIWNFFTQTITTLVLEVFQNLQQLVTIKSSRTSSQLESFDYEVKIWTQKIFVCKIFNFTKNYLLLGQLFVVAEAQILIPTL